MGLGQYCLLKGSNGFNSFVVKDISMVIIVDLHSMVMTGPKLHDSNAFHGLAGNFGLCTHLPHVTRHSTLTQFKFKFDACM